MLNFDKFNKAILHAWLREEVAPNLPFGIQNLDLLWQQILNAMNNNLAIKLLCVGCQNWKLISANDETYIIKNIDLKNSRARKTAVRITSFVNSLKSYDVESKLFVCLSMTEAILFNRLGVCGINVVAKDKSIHELGVASLKNFIELLNNNGVDPQAIDDFQLFLDNEKVSNERDLFYCVANDHGADVALFEKRIYKYLVQKLPVALCDYDNDFVWIDLMSPLANWHRDELYLQVKQQLPQVPIFAISHNAGKWWTRAERTESNFCTRKEFMCRKLNIPHLRKVNFAKRLDELHNSEINDFFISLDFDFVVTNEADRLLALRLLYEAMDL